MSQLDGKSLDIKEKNIENLKQLFPEAFTEDKVDMEMLSQILGECTEDATERYNFSWNGKGEALRISQTPSLGTLLPCEEESKDWETTQNLYIEGDNLEVLKLLQKSYYGKVKMIYIDPPYNTGKDFVYKDNFHDNIQNYKEITGQVDNDGNRLSTNPETNGRYHTDWLNMMYPRLRLSRNLLTDDGVIFISIDDNEQANLKKICDEIFGEGNFISQVIWQKKTGASDAKSLATITEYALIYSKNRLLAEFGFAKNTDSYDLARYRFQDEHSGKRGPYYIDNLDRGGLQYSDSLNYGIKCPDGVTTFPNGRTTYENDGWIWKWSKSKIQWGLENNFIEFRESKNKRSGWAVCYKNYLLVDNEDNPIERGAPYKNMVTDILNAQATSDIKDLFGSSVFPYTKPAALIEHYLSFLNYEENSVVLDFFSGSATTAHAVMQLNAEDGGNRKFIMVQLPEETAETSEAFKAGYKNICEIGKERIRRAGELIKAELVEKSKQTTLTDGKTATNPNELDIGFKVLKLDTSNIRKWNPNADDLEQSLEDYIDQYMDDRSEEDVVYELMLKMGLELTYPIEKVAAGDQTVYSIGFGGLMICLGNTITTEVADKMVALYNDLKPETWRVVFKDNGFSDDSMKTNVKETLKSAGLEDDAFLTL